MAILRKLLSLALLAGLFAAARAEADELKITVNPVGNKVRNGESVEFSVEATGGNGDLSYVWYCKKEVFQDEGESVWYDLRFDGLSSLFEHYKTPTLICDLTNKVTFYMVLKLRCRVRDSYGVEVYSEPVTLVINGGGGEDSGGEGSGVGECSTGAGALGIAAVFAIAAARRMRGLKK